MLPVAIWSQAEREQHDVRVEKTLAVKRKQTVASRNQAAATVAAKGEHHWCTLACVAEKVSNAQAQIETPQDGRGEKKALCTLLCGLRLVRV